MVSLSKMKLEELIYKAQQCNYVAPEGDMTTWSDDDAVLAGTYEFIKSPLFIRICGMVCKTFPPIKIIIKLIDWGQCLDHIIIFRDFSNL